MNWKNINEVPPDKNQAILVINSWNISEDDLERISNMAPDFMSIRVAFYDHEKNMWSTFSEDDE